ncbi:MAG: adenosylcobinamide amidohydrolase [Marinibacterium sp.]|nr:adenosylcobinamide amidohydrolase [Marinibacterium sp.]
MTRVTLDAPWLSFELGKPMQVLSWSVNRPGFTIASRILWREVRNADLPPDLDLTAWVDDLLGARGATDAVLLLTSRRIAAFEQAQATAGSATARAVATVGLSNAERVGHRVDYSARSWGTVNVAVQVDTGLSETGLIEAMSIAVQARTTAIIDAGVQLETGAATGTGTDCLAIAAPKGVTDFAGLHTDTGEAIGRAVYDSVHAGAIAWIRDNRERTHA